MQQNTNQPSHELKHKTPKHNAGNKSRKPLAVVTIVLAVALALMVGGYFGYKYYESRQAVSPLPIIDLENKPDIKREDTGVNLSKNNRTGIGEVTTGGPQ